MRKKRQKPILTYRLSGEDTNKSKKSHTPTQDNVTPTGYPMIYIPLCYKIICSVLLPERSTGTMDMNRSYTFGAPYGDSPECPYGRLSAWTALMCYILSQFSFCINVFLK